MGECYVKWLDISETTRSWKEYSNINQDVFGSVRVPTIFKHQDVLCFCET